MKNLKLIALLVIPTLFSTSCSNDDAPVNEEEVITTVTTTLSGGGQIVTLTSRDLDGDGPNAPVVTVSGNLVAGRTYLGSTTFLNELANPAEDITSVQTIAVRVIVFFIYKIVDWLTKIFKRLE